MHLLFTHVLFKRAPEKPDEPKTDKKYNEANYKLRAIIYKPYKGLIVEEVQIHLQRKEFRGFILRISPPKLWGHQ